MQHKAIVSSWNHFCNFLIKGILYGQQTHIDSFWMAQIPSVIFPYQQIDQYESAWKSSLGGPSNVKTPSKGVRIQFMVAGQLLMLFRLTVPNQNLRLHLR